MFAFQNTSHKIYYHFKKIVSSAYNKVLMKKIITKVYKLAFVKLILVFSLLYLFLSAITMMSTAFDLLGYGFSAAIMDVTASPITALFIGIISTAIVQSSSVTTSMVVGLVSAGTISVANAIPIVMGANIGTTITNTIVSVGHIGRKKDFRRAFSGSLIHDIFNVFTVIIVFPLEMTTGFLHKSATFLAEMFYKTQPTAHNINYHSPIKLATQIIPSYLKKLLLTGFSLPENITGVCLLIFSLVFIFFALLMIVKVMRSVMLRKIEKIINEFLNKSAFISIFTGILVTVLVQSSSITTSILVTLMGAGLLTMEAAFPVMLGANVGTTITAILASLAGNVAGLTIAFVHLLFNISGILIIYPIKRIRRIPLFIAIKVARKVSKNKFMLIYYVFGLFFVVPLIFISLDKFIF